MMPYLADFMRQAADAYSNEEHRRQLNAMKRYFEAGKQPAVVDYGPSATEMLRQRDLSVTGMDKRQEVPGKGKSAGYVRMIREQEELAAANQAEEDARNSLLKGMRGDIENYPSLRGLYDEMYESGNIDPLRWSTEVGKAKQAGTGKKAEKITWEGREYTKQDFEQYVIAPLKASVKGIPAHELNKRVGKVGSRGRQEYETGLRDAQARLQKAMDKIAPRLPKTTNVTQRFMKELNSDPMKLQAFLSGGYDMEGLQGAGIDIDLVRQILEEDIPYRE